MKCPNCGYENGESSKFCLKCGTKLTEEQVNKNVSEDAEVKKTDIDKVFETEQVNEVKSGQLFTSENSEKINEPASAGGVHKSDFWGESKSKILMIAGSAAVIALVGGCIAWDNYRQNNIAEEVKPTPSYVDVLKTNDMEESKETSAETTVQSQTETTTGETEQAAEEYNNAEEQPLKFDVGDIAIEFTTKDEYYVTDNCCMGYFTYIPRVTKITSSPEAATKIENALADILSFEYLTFKENGIKMDKCPTENMYKMGIQNNIENIYAENGLLLVTINEITDNGGGVSLSVSSMEKTYIFNLSDGNELKLDDIVKDKESFLSVIDAYIYKTVYDRTYVNTDYDSYNGYEDYTLGADTSYDDFVTETAKNPWYDGEWSYDGKSFGVNYHYLLGFQTIYKETRFYIPKSDIIEFLNFSVSSSGQNADGALKDELGFKIMSGNTAANYANYTEYCFDSEYMYYAGGEDGYHWQLRKNYIGGSGSDGELLSDDMTDAVMVYGDRIYYRNATDGYKLYSISKNGTDKKMLTDSKASGIRIYDGKIYYTSDSKLYRMELDGGDRKKILDRACYDLQIYDDLLYITSADSSCVEIYDLSGVYQGSISSSITPTIKRFFVSYGNCVMSNDDSISIYNVNTYEVNGFTNVNVKGISEDKDNYIVILDEMDGYFAAIVPKSDPTTLDYYDYAPNVNDREFYIVYNNSGDYIYTFDKDGVVTSEAFGY